MRKISIFLVIVLTIVAAIGFKYMSYKNEYNVQLSLKKSNSLLEFFEARNGDKVNYFLIELFFARLTSHLGVVGNQKILVGYYLKQFFN